MQRTFPENGQFWLKKYFLPNVYNCIFWIGDFLWTGDTLSHRTGCPPQMKFSVLPFLPLITCMRGPIVFILVCALLQGWVLLGVNTVHEVRTCMPLRKLPMGKEHSQNVVEGSATSQILDTRLQIVYGFRHFLYKHQYMYIYIYIFFFIFITDICGKATVRFKFKLVELVWNLQIARHTLRDMQMSYRAGHHHVENFNEISFNGKEFARCRN